MSFDDVHNRVVKKFDSKIVSEFKKMLHGGLESYRRHNTKAKLASVIMNLPIGMFMKSHNIDRLLVDGRPPSYKALLDLLEDGGRFNIEIKE